MASALLNSFKTSTAGISSWSFARSAPRRLPAAFHTSRRYSSEDKSANGAPEQEKEEKKEDEKSDKKCAETTEKLKTKEAEVVDLTGRLRYLQADFINLQRNSAREKEQTRDFAISKFASDLLETVDVLAIALKSVPSEALSKGSSGSLSKSHAEYLHDLHTGVEMTHRLLLQTLFKYHVKPFDPTGEKFDPNFHEALYQAPIPGKEPGTVVDCQKIGYTIKDRVLRAAQVGVAQETS